MESIDVTIYGNETQLCSNLYCAKGYHLMVENETVCVKNANMLEMRNSTLFQLGLIEAQRLQFAQNQ